MITRACQSPPPAPPKKLPRRVSPPKSADDPPRPPIDATQAIEASRKAAEIPKGRPLKLRMPKLGVRSQEYINGDGTFVGVSKQFIKDMQYGISKRVWYW